VFNALRKKMQEDDSPYVTAMSTISLGKLGDQNVSPNLLELLHYSQRKEFWNIKVRREAGRALHTLVRYIIQLHLVMFSEEK
jgi:hypothetical protein